MPTVPVIAGPNGSGKSTITRSLDFEGKDRLLDPDAIAKRMNPSDPGSVAAAAGREAIRRTREYISTGVSFAIETTLSSSGMVDTMRQARQVTHEASVLSNAGGEPELLLLAQDGAITWLTPDPPAWLTTAVANLTGNPTPPDPHGS